MRERLSNFVAGRGQPRSAASTTLFDPALNLHHRRAAVQASTRVLSALAAAPTQV